MRQVASAGALLDASPPQVMVASPRNESREALCRKMEASCHEDAMCHVNQWESTLAKPICQR